MFSWTFDIGTYIFKSKDNNTLSTSTQKTVKSSVFKVRELHLHRPEFDAPADIAIGRRGLPPHAVPVRRLQVLKMICNLCVVVPPLHSPSKITSGSRTNRCATCREQVVDAFFCSVQSGFIYLYVHIIITSSTRVEVASSTHVGCRCTIPRFRSFLVPDPAKRLSPFDDDDSEVLLSSRIRCDRQRT